MTVLRIVSNVASDDVGAGDRFYRDVLGLDVLMDLGFIRTYGSRKTTTVQMSVLTEGGAGTEVPALSVEVDDLDAVFEKVKAAKIPIEYGPVTETWGVRRFYVRDPFGRLVNILRHDP